MAMLNKPEGNCLVVEPPTPSEKWWSEWKSVGMMTFPTEWKSNPNVPNHEPDKYIPLNLIKSHRISHEILATLQLNDLTFKSWFNP